MNPDLGQLSDPFLFAGMDKAVQVIKAAKRDGVRAVVYGDYDVDGVCASTIMWDALRTLGMEAAVYIPDRHEEGYGLNAAAIEHIAQGAGLLVTVDCGITAVSEVALAKEKGMRVIVTDHHHLPEKLPEADAVLSPLIAPYPFPYLCGAGVAYQLCRALLSDEAARDCLDLAALATVADMVPLTGENRALVRFGLEKLSHTARPGLRALIRAAGLPDALRSEHIAFALAPRLNACGRLESALNALELLETQDEDEAQRLALRLESLNQERRMLEKAVLDDARERMAGLNLCAERAVVLCGEGYESGVVGLAAGRLADQTGYPTVILSKQGDLAVGSARSAGGIDIFQALSCCSDLFIRFGGHSQAAGMTLKYADVPALETRLSAAVEKQLAGRPLVVTRAYDAELPLDQVNQETVARLSLLEPYGMGNPAPVFLLKNVEPIALRAVGAGGAHLKLSLLQGDVQRAGIAFGMGALAARAPGRMDALFSPTRNEFMGRVSFECRVSALRADPLTFPQDKKSEEEAVLQDFCAAGQNKLQFPIQLIGEDALDGLMRAPQGTLLFCRCFETAQKLLKRFKRADFFEGRADDPRAFSAVCCGVPAGRVSPFYRDVVLCDGMLRQDEGALFRGGTRLWMLPKTGVLSARIDALTPTVQNLRDALVALRKTHPVSLARMAQALQMSETRLKAALTILGELLLVDFSLEPFSVSLRPTRRCDPSESELYARLLRGKEAV